jgi:hypothetical protein
MIMSLELREERGRGREEGSEEKWVWLRHGVTIRGAIQSFIYSGF